MKNIASACITTDGWTSINNDHFTAVTTHYINENFMVRSNLLGCINFQDKQNAKKDLKPLIKHS